MQLPKEFHHHLGAVVNVGVALGVMTPARLVAPNEVSILHNAPEKIDGANASWLLLAEVPNDMLRELERLGDEEIIYGAQANLSHSGYRYFTFVVEAGGFQHKVNVPVLGDGAMEWLLSLADGDNMMIVLTDRERNRAVELEFALAREFIDELTGGITWMPKNMCEVLEDSAAMTLSMLLIAQQAAAAGISNARRLSVSTVIPIEIEQRLSS